jgi:uncharacterized Zn finger protein
MTMLKFLVQGSMPEPYEITFRRSADRLNALCTCPAGDHAQACKHRIGLMRGDVSSLVGGDDPSLIAAMIAGTIAIAALADLDRAEADLEEAKRKVSARKNALSRVISAAIDDA